MKLSDEYGIGDCTLTAQQHDPLIALGVIEYANDRFAHLHANERFLSEFALSNHPHPASGVFREHLDDKNYNILMQTFAYCPETKQEAVVRLSRTDDTGAQRQELYDRADEALYRVKEQGRCGCCVYEGICEN